MIKKTPHIIALFTRHRVAANLLMIIMLLSGAWALTQLNIQFLPTYSPKTITINIEWPGANAEDIENSITNPIEVELRDLDHVKKITSTSTNSSSNITIEFKQRTEMGPQLERVKERVSLVRSLPTDSEPPIINRVEIYEPIAKLLISGNADIQELRPIIYKIERELLDAGIAKIEIRGLPDEQISIEIPTRRLAELRHSLDQIAERIAERSQDLPAGTVGRSEVGKQLRSLSQQRGVQGFKDLELVSGEAGRLLRVGDIATVVRKALDNEVIVTHDGKPTVELSLLRSEGAHALDSAKTFQDWLVKAKIEYGESIEIQVFDEMWTFIRDRINLLLKNGGQGLILILIILFLFLNERVAFWVAMGIPASFMAALAVLLLAGGSINMVSLFALIMTLGIIVDDTIVVGENALMHYMEGMDSITAIDHATRKMLAPIMASSLTTICAFFPTMLVSGIMGTILFAIPLVVISVIAASLVECFFVLPGHLHHSLPKYKLTKEHPFRQSINKAFDDFRENKFRLWITWAIKNRWVTLSSAFAAFLFCAGMVLGGHINFNFFVSPEGYVLNASAQFTAGTSPETLEQFLSQAYEALMETNEELKEDGADIVKTAIAYQHYDGALQKEGVQNATITAELITPDHRELTNSKFISTWQEKIQIPAGMENFAIIERVGGPPGKDIDIQFSGDDPMVLKQAALELEDALRSFNGVSNIRDDLPFGQEQLVYELNANGRSVGLTIQQVGRQLHAAFTGRLVQIFHTQNDEVEVRVQLPDDERDSIVTLEQFPILTMDGEIVPLGTVVNLEFKRGFDILRHANNRLSVNISVDVDERETNANKIISKLNESTLPNIVDKYHVGVQLEGKAEEQAETFSDMRYGVVLGLSLIYIILAWIFSSYTWPLIVMTAIPLGLKIMGIDLTILSLFGLFGLSGIVINDSIILMSTYKGLREEGMPVQEAIIEASCKRLRAVLLTSLTTIAGLTPLLFETSFQAQFLIPMAVSISFGLAFATILILIVVPAMLSIKEL